MNKTTLGFAGPTGLCSPASIANPPSDVAAAREAAYDAALRLTYSFSGI